MVTGGIMRRLSRRSRSSGSVLTGLRARCLAWLSAFGAALSGGAAHPGPAAAAVMQDPPPPGFEQRVAELRRRAAAQGLTPSAMAPAETGEAKLAQWFNWPNHWFNFPNWRNW
jgi:hypothetical protein